MNWEDHNIFRWLAYEMLFTGLFTFPIFYSQFNNAEKTNIANGLRVLGFFRDSDLAAEKPALVHKFFTDLSR